MELTNVERLLLANQYRILERLDGDSGHHWEQSAEILERGYSGQYASLFSGYDEGLSPEECGEVVDILNMYRALHVAYRDLPDHAGMSAEEVVFGGFDGNNESKQHAYVRFMFEDQNKWGELKGVALDSHSPMLHRYRPMLEEWKNSKSRYELTQSDVARINRCHS